MTSQKNNSKSTQILKMQIINVKKLLLPRRITFLFLAFWAFLFLIVFWPNKHPNTMKQSKWGKVDLSHPLIIWWRPMGGVEENYFSTRICGSKECSFTVQRDYIDDASALLFYGSKFDIADLPLPRSAHHIWALLHEESPRNLPFMSQANFLKHFNLTSTLSRYSDYPLTTIYLHDARDLTTPRYLVPVGEKTRLQQKENLAPIVFLQSDCDTLSERDAFVKELMRYIPVDSYGACLHNSELPPSLSDDYLNKLYSTELYTFLGRYKFILSYENAVCHDYITEKFWRPLVVGSVPIYFGSPTIKDWLPNSKSAILINDFPSPKSLSEYIKSVNSNDSEYNTFLEHKYNQVEPISNKKLKDELLLRDYSPSVDPNIFGLFECFVCQQLHNIPDSKHRMSTINHYNCPFPPLYPSMPGERSSTYKTWKSIMSVGKCSAEILDDLLQQNKVFSKDHFQDLLTKKVSSGACDF